MIDDEEIQRALDYLRDSAVDAAQARANRIYMQEYSKSLKALIMREHLDLPVSAQEREACADHRYLTHLSAMQTAIKLDEQHRFLRVAAEAKIEAWRSLSANQRAMKI
mgnify:CR=1 FL=1|tara:strand:- start:313 stop:636 length:324 start_codon:yes stop_codon:yes gene_type:complete